MGIDIGDDTKLSSMQKRISTTVDVSSPQFLPDTIDSIARARSHLAKGRKAVCAELLTLAEARLDLYHKVVAKRWLYGSREGR